MLMCVQNLVRLCQLVLKILSGNKILMSIKGRNSDKILRKMTGNNPKLDLVDDDVHTKFGQIYLFIGNFMITYIHTKYIHMYQRIRQ